MQQSRGSLESLRGKPFVWGRLREIKLPQTHRLNVAVHKSQICEVGVPRRGAGIRVIVENTAWGSELEGVCGARRREVVFRADFPQHHRAGG